MSKSHKQLDSLQTVIDSCLIQDRSEITKLAKIIEQRQKQKLPSDKLISKYNHLLKRSQRTFQQRQSMMPRAISFDQALPICQKKEEIADLIQNHQLVVVAGETGSGKTTQIPKICLDMGFGISGRIGHTQPRRVAATSVARRIAEELESPLGDTVGYSVRFNDSCKDSTAVRIMTDGILLNEISQDPLLLQYQVLIIDEAHERSLNIDFILGYLKQLLSKRPDLKVIITSATIDLERFAKHFAQHGKAAPVIEVSGRTYPVEVWYREPDEENPSPQVEQIGHAVEELMHYAAGDILVFLSGEADIRETAKFLRKEKFRDCQVLPLYARLSIGEQEKIFKPSAGKRRIILSTNVAETSVTVPGIRFVIDPGNARISRYSIRHKIQRLPIEKISQASANQRKGRCGRVADGVCIRLYSEEDFNNRSEFTDAEILRTNLAWVILQMQQAKLGDIEAFPFIDKPSTKQINDGVNLLLELQALNSDKRLTAIGQAMATLPIEPRLARILIEAKKQQIPAEALVLAAFLSVKDPREWPFDKKELATQKHRKYQHSRSDFISIINLWQHLHQQQEALSNRQFRDYCQQELINFNGYREWKSTYRQLKQLLTQDKSKTQKSPQKLAALSDFSQLDKQQEAAQYQKLHQVLLTGFLSFVGQKDIEKGYLAARQSKYFIHPQSVNFKKQPAWLMAFEVVETTQAYARLTAFIEVQWLEQAAKHLLKTHYFEPFWSKNRGAVLAPMQQTLYGLKIVVDRKVDYSAIEPQLCRQLFIQHALVRHELNSRDQFFINNQQVLAEVKQEVAKARQADLVASETVVADWFEQRLPEFVNNAKSLNQWLKSDKHNSQTLALSKKVLLEETEQDEGQFPSTVVVRGIELKVKYHFEPGHPQDGVTVLIPSSLRNKFIDTDFERLVPGLLAEKIEYLIRSMPKRFRKNFLPVPTYAQACYEQVIEQAGTLKDIVSKQLYQMTGVILTQEAWSQTQLPEHLLMRFEIINDDKKIIYSGRSLEAPTKTVKTAKFSKNLSQQIKSQQTYADWSFKFQPQGVIKEAGTIIPVYFAVEDAGLDKVRLVSSVSQKLADKTHLQGVSRLIAIANNDKYKYLLKSNPHKQTLSLAASTFGRYDDLVMSAFLAVIKQQFLLAEIPKTQQQFAAANKAIASELVALTTQALERLAKTLQQRAAIFTQVKKLSKNFAGLKDDIEEQLAYLFENNFLYRYGVDKLSDYGRYLKAIETRIEKARETLLKEASLTNQINPWLDLRIELEANAKIPEEGYLQYLWMLEEFRISLFAQGQKTQFPISAKRLQKYSQQLESNYQ
ncbi:ATP-dependent RNA helicase HrpA [Kangiella sp. TOML190]|uniref:ATP-dependent RNA helicase HrpA n=1 Tax=Kangiella sp. TOML190 TaxID=2931351 RepID=UPI0020403A3D|nr:ATP-dependent RNA helicase HrpA [Kangiella sp. TOML190]